jgi:hypothetical protein
LFLLLFFFLFFFFQEWLQQETILFGLLKVSQACLELAARGLVSRQAAAWWGGMVEAWWASRLAVVLGWQPACSFNVLWHREKPSMG